MSSRFCSLVGGLYAAAGLQTNTVHLKIFSTVCFEEVCKGDEEEHATKSGHVLSDVAQTLSLQRRHSLESGGSISENSSSNRVWLGVDPTLWAFIVHSPG